MDENAEIIMLGFSDYQSQQAVPPSAAEGSGSPSTTPASEGATAAALAGPSVVKSSKRPASTGPSTSKSPVTWTEELDVVLCREVDLVNPFKFKQRTKDSSKAWDAITASLVSQGHPVSKRAVREHYYRVKETVSKRNRIEEAASGIAPELTPTQQELTQLVEDLTDLEAESKLQHQEHQQKEEKKAMDGIEIRNRAMETYKETAKRNKSEKDGPRKRRNTGADATDFLMRKLEVDQENREREATLQREEAERREAREQRKEAREQRDAERRRQDDAARDKKMDMMQQQLLATNQMILTFIMSQKKD